MRNQFQFNLVCIFSKIPGKTVGVVTSLEPVGGSVHILNVVKKIVNPLGKWRLYIHTDGGKNRSYIK